MNGYSCIRDTKIPSKIQIFNHSEKVYFHWTLWHFCAGSNKITLPQRWLLMNYSEKKRTSIRIIKSSNLNLAKKTCTLIFKKCRRKLGETLDQLDWILPFSLSLKYLIKKANFSTGHCWYFNRKALWAASTATSLTVSRQHFTCGKSLYIIVFPFQID